MYDAEQTRANIEYYLRNGRCPRCGGANKLEPGKKTCRECALKISEAWRNRRAWRRENGQCTRCGKILPEGSEFIQCDDCRAYLRSYGKFNKERYERFKEAGKCVHCGKLVEPGKVLCKKCLDYHVEYNRTDNGAACREKYRQKRKERIESGLCIDCGRPVKEEGYTRCKRCRDMRMDSCRKYRIKKKLAKEAEEARRRTRA